MLLTHFALAVILLYTTFETAKKYYLEKGIIEGDSPEIIEFNSLMKFRYTGIRMDDESEEK